MQIEFISCTGAGKSTLIKRLLLANLEKQQSLMRSHDFVLQYSRLALIRNRSIKTIALNILAIFMCARAWPRYRTFLKFSFSCLARLKHEVSLSERLQILRITLRNVGVSEFVRRYARSGPWFIADEGFLQIAHYLFVHTGVAPTPELIEKFASLAPLPRVLVYIRQPDALLVERTLRRGHKRISPGSSQQVVDFIRHATQMFEVLIQQPGIRERVVVIDAEQLLVPRSLQLEPAMAQVCALVEPLFSSRVQATLATGAVN